MQILNPSRWYLHPVFIFACSIFALATFLVLTVSLYMEIRSALEVVILRFNIDSQSIFPSKTGMTILVLSLLIAVVLAGIFLAFIYYQKTVNLFRLQHNFIYNFTHELKTPVTSLRIYLETFIRHPMEAGDVKKYSENMLKDIDRLTENIDRILNLARIESQNFGSKVTRDSMVSLVEAFCEKNASIFRDLDIRIKNPSGGRFEYPVNLFLFEILLMNIISNAIKYNESDHPRLTIEFKSYLQKTTIDFIDNGIGVDRQEAKKIFRKFYQAGSKHADSSATGSGLGLYLVSSIAMIHGWRASVSSAGIGKGSKFTITIPRASIASVREKKIMEAAEKKRVLVIEDEAHIADGIRLNLNIQGYDAQVAPDGIEGLEKWRTWRPDLIVLDIMLPMIDGFSILKTIRQEDDKIPVLILSARGDTRDKVKGLRYGVDDYLSKPFDLEEFLLRVARLLKKGEWVAPRSTLKKGCHTLFDGDTYRFGDNEINFVTFKADCVAGEIILTEQEATLLKIFIANKGKPLSREMLLNAGWGYSRDTSTRTVDNFIVRFRKYFEEKPKKPVFFKSRRSVGYIFDHD